MRVHDGADQRSGHGRAAVEAWPLPPDDGSSRIRRHQIGQGVDGRRDRRGAEDAAQEQQDGRRAGAARQCRQRGQRAKEDEEKRRGRPSRQGAVQHATDGRPQAGGCEHPSDHLGTAHRPHRGDGRQLNTAQAESGRDDC